MKRKCWGLPARQELGTKIVGYEDNSDSSHGHQCCLPIGEIVLWIVDDDDRLDKRADQDETSGVSCLVGQS